MVKMSKENPITKRSKKTIVDAMMGLLQDKSYEKITIKEIMEKADMARRTFYGNFNSKDEIMHYYFGGFFERLSQRINKEGIASPKKLAETLFELVLEDKDNMMVAKKQGLLNMALLEKYSGEFTEFFSKNIATITNQKAFNYAAGFYLGGVWKVMEQWLGEGAKDSPKKMAEMFQNIMSVTAFNLGTQGAKQD